MLLADNCFLMGTTSFCSHSIFKAESPFEHSIKAFHWEYSHSLAYVWVFYDLNLTIPLPLQRFWRQKGASVSPSILNLLISLFFPSSYRNSLWKNRVFQRTNGLQFRSLAFWFWKNKWFPTPKISSFKELGNFIKRVAWGLCTSWSRDTQSLCFAHSHHNLTFTS